MTIDWSQVTEEAVIVPRRMSRTAGVRQQIQHLLNQHQGLTQAEMVQMLGHSPHLINRALNWQPNPRLGETPFARHWDEVNKVWVWYAVRPDNPLTQEDFNAKIKTAQTQLHKAQENLLAPAVAAGAVANGDGDALDVTLQHVNAALTSIDAATRAGREKAETLAMARQNQNDRARLDQERADWEAEKTRRERDLVRKERALTTARQPRDPAKRIVRKRK